MARISELHYSNAFAASTGIAEFAEVALDPSDNPADFVIGFYNLDGSLIFEVALTDPGVTSNLDPSTGETFYVISSSVYPFVLTDPDGSGGDNAEAVALTNVTAGNVVGFFDIGGGTANITPTAGAAFVADPTIVSTNIPVPTSPGAANYSVQFNQPNPTIPVTVPLSPGEDGVFCFVSGAEIDTPDGPRRVEDLAPGDLVVTRDCGALPLSWTGACKVPATGHLAPIVFRAGTLGALRDTAVSPQHRILLSGWQAELLFGVSELLVPATALINDSTVFRRTGGRVTYHHIMFEDHQIVRADGMWSESFHPGPCALGMLAPDTLSELLELFPELAECNTGAHCAARQVLRRSEGLVLANALRL